MSKAVTAYHEASHAVTAVKLGIEVLLVTIAKSDPKTEIVPALDRAKKARRAVRPQDFEHDAINALAGLAAQRRSHPETVPVVISYDWPDVFEARAAVLRMVYLRSGRSLPKGKADIDLDAATTQEFRAEYARIERQAAILVAEHWPAIVRVAKHLERRGRITDRATLEDLIARAERRANVGR